MPKPTEGVSLALLKQRAHGRVRSQIKAGLMVRPKVCSKCSANPGLGRDGRSLLQAHHHKGYEFPLEVEWLCVQCHRDETPLNPARGDKHWFAKITDQEAAEIRNSPMGNGYLARKHGITHKHVWDIKTGRSRATTSNSEGAAS